MVKYYVYILYSKGFDRLYIGQTNNVEDRINRHNKGYEKTTKPYIPWEVVFIEEHFTRDDAVKRESFWKQSNNRRFIKSNFLSQG